MSLDLERQIIEAYFIANWTATPYGLDAQTFAPTYGLDGKPQTCVRLSLIDGDMAQESIGRTQNVFITPAMLSLAIYHDGALGSSAWRATADSLITLFFDITLDETGALVTTASQTAFLRFAPPQLGNSRFAQLGPLMTEAPFAVKPLTIPFIRYETR